jgi:hypothetical protein
MAFFRFLLPSFFNSVMLTWLWQRIMHGQLAFFQRTPLARLVAVFSSDQVRNLILPNSISFMTSADCACRSG